MNKVLNGPLCWYEFNDKKIIEIYDEFSLLNNKKIETIHIDDINKLNGYSDLIILSNVISLDYSILDKVDKLLNKNGHIIIIEKNKIGLESIANIDTKVSNKNGVYKNELDQLLLKKYKHIKYYYPYQDIYNISEVFTDATINIKHPIDAYVPVFNDAINVLDRKDVNSGLMINEIGQYFANYFIVEASNCIFTNDIEYLRINSNRKEQFQIITEVSYSNRKVFKRPININACEHLINMSKNDFSINKIESLKYCWDQDNKFAYCDFVDIPCLKDVFDSYLQSNNIDGILCIINDIKENMYIGDKKSQEEDNRFNNVFGNDKVQEQLHWLECANIDMNFSNIYINKDKYLLIDNEWFFDFPIPAEFVLWLAFRIYSSLGLDNYVLLDHIYDSIEINKDTEKVFEKWASHFDKEYVGKADNEYRRYFFTDVYHELDLIKNSTIWKSTMPIRRVLDILKKREN